MRSETLERLRGLGGGGEAGGDGVPVHGVPPSGDVIGALVLVFEVVGVFPNVAAEERGAGAVHERVVLVGSGGDGDFAVFGDEPGPAGAEAGGTGFGESFFEGVEGAEGSGDGIGEGTGGGAAGVGGHDGPEEAVVVMTAAIVTDGSADVFGDAIDVFAEVFDRVRFEVCFAGDGGVQVGDVGVVVAAMVDFHGLLVDMGFESVVSVRKFR